jgi:hypothetical protein
MCFFRLVTDCYNIKLAIHIIKKLILQWNITFPVFQMMQHDNYTQFIVSPSSYQITYMDLCITIIIIMAEYNLINANYLQTIRYIFRVPLHVESSTLINLGMGTFLSQTSTVQLLTMFSFT